ncbi:MAG: DNA-directed RNA polymerase subunit delta [Flavobacteriaceae bacterium]|jgi:hypothetical protein|uniref:hypothetical protein n=1 Tax=Candidatus Marifrigoribacter sp. Uisw_064 TaxID=3230970 RepID=UPI003ADFB751
MRRVIVDYKKLNEDILDLLVDKFPHGYSDSDVISFRNSKNELIKAVEVRNVDTIFLVKIGVYLINAIEDHDAPLGDENINPISGFDTEE